MPLPALFPLVYQCETERCILVQLNFYTEWAW